jgi:hypothetical protein
VGSSGFSGVGVIFGTAVMARRTGRRDRGVRGIPGAVADRGAGVARVSYGPPWAHYLGGYQDRLLGGPLGLPSLRYTAPDGVEHKDYRGEVLG